MRARACGTTRSDARRAGRRQARSFLRGATRVPCRDLRRLRGAGRRPFAPRNDRPGLLQLLLRQGARRHAEFRLPSSTFPRNSSVWERRPGPEGAGLLIPGPPHSSRAASIRASQTLAQPRRRSGASHANSGRRCSMGVIIIREMVGTSPHRGATRHARRLPRHRRRSATSRRIEVVKSSAVWSATARSSSTGST